MAARRFAAGPVERTARAAAQRQLVLPHVRTQHLFSWPVLRLCLHLHGDQMLGISGSASQARHELERVYTTALEGSENLAREAFLHSLGLLGRRRRRHVAIDDRTRCCCKEAVIKVTTFIRQLAFGVKFGYNCVATRNNLRHSTTLAWLIAL